MSNNIDRFRGLKNLTYLDIAEKTGLTAMYIHSLAKGKRTNPSLRAMQSIAEALGESIEDVFQLDERSKH